MTDHRAALAAHLAARFGDAPALPDDLPGVETLARMANHRTIRAYADRPVDPALMRVLAAVALPRRIQPWLAALTAALALSATAIAWPREPLKSITAPAGTLQVSRLHFVTLNDLLSTTRPGDTGNDSRDCSIGVPVEPGDSVTGLVTGAKATRLMPFPADSTR